LFVNEGFVKMTRLDAVFWDRPDLSTERSFKAFLSKSRGGGAYTWILSRFLEHGRAVDTLKYFSISEIKEALSSLKLTGYTNRKWKRLIEIYTDT